MTFLHTWTSAILLVVVVSGGSYEGFDLAIKERERCQRKKHKKTKKARAKK